VAFVARASRAHGSTQDRGWREARQALGKRAGGVITRGDGRQGLASADPAAIPSEGKDIAADIAKGPFPGTYKRELPLKIETISA